MPGTDWVWRRRENSNAELSLIWPAHFNGHRHAPNPSDLAGRRRRPIRRSLRHVTFYEQSPGQYGLTRFYPMLKFVCLNLPKG